MSYKHLFYYRFAFLLASMLATMPLLLYSQTDVPMHDGETPQTGETSQKEKASPDSAFVRYFYPDTDGSYELNKVSNATLYHFQDYDAIQKSKTLYANLGNTGSASSPLTFYFNTNPSFDIWLKSFSPYELTFDSSKFYISDSPYTRLSYVMGSAKEQRLEVIHSQQVRKGFTLGLNARFANAPGIYERQRTFYTGVTANASYFTPGKRYGVIATYLNDRFSVYENGGLKYDSVFTDNVEDKRKAILINYDDAMNRHKTGGFMFQHYFNLQKSQIKEVDSLGQPIKSRRFDAGRFVHTFRYYRNSAAYEDFTNDTLYLPSSILISSLTYDTSAVVHFENSFVYSNIEPDTTSKVFPLQYAFGIKQMHDKVFNDTASRVFTHLMPFGTLRGIIAGKTFFTANGRIFLGDYNNGDFDLSGEFYQFIGKKNEYRLWLSASNGLIHPDYYFQHYVSGEYSWDNDLKSQGYQSGTAGLDIKGFRLSATITRISNYVYLNKESQPDQLSDGIGVLSFNVNKDFRLGHWMIGGFGTWQQATNESVLSLPSISARLTICYNIDLFKNVLKTETGIDLRYNTSYYANAYNPVLRSFYLQDQEKFGNYPYGDVFVNFKVKRARIFIKYQHANARLLGYKYIMVPGYPQADASLKFGVSWVFFD
jgi:hypothetical protein